MNFNPGGDLCLGFWAEAWNAGVLSFPQNANVLEIGCAEADWITPMLKARPDLLITGLDWRSCKRPGNIVQGDVLTWTPEAQFDAIVSVSAIEHIGLGSYSQDPLHPDGDSVAVARSYDWLKPGGWMYLDVPYRPNGPYCVTKNFRAYDEEALQKRLIVAGFKETWRKVVGEGKGDGPYIALVLTK